MRRHTGRPDRDHVHHRSASRDEWRRCEPCTLQVTDDDIGDLHAAQCRVERSRTRNSGRTEHRIAGRLQGLFGVPHNDHDGRRLCSRQIRRGDGRFPAPRMGACREHQRGDQRG